jgi:hypothetical protein
VRVLAGVRGVLPHHATLAPYDGRLRHEGAGTAAGELALVEECRSQPAPLAVTRGLSARRSRGARRPNLVRIKP